MGYFTLAQHILAAARRNRRERNRARRQARIEAREERQERAAAKNPAEGAQGRQ